MVQEKIQIQLPIGYNAKTVVERLKKQPGILKLFIVSPSVVWVTYNRRRITAQQIAKTITRHTHEA